MLLGAAFVGSRRRLYRLTEAVFLRNRRLSKDVSMVSRGCVKRFLVDHGRLSALATEGYV